MILASIIGILLFIIYILFIKGYLFKGILAISGCFFIYNFLNKYTWAQNGISFDGYMISISAIIPAILLLLAMAFTYED